VIANEEGLQAVLGVQVASVGVAGGALDVAGYHAAAERVTREFGPSIVGDAGRKPVGERQRLSAVRGTAPAGRAAESVVRCPTR
jgi:hypothetical protein